MIGRAGRGALLYLPQEGRGIGLRDKLRAYNLQDQGLDTVEANLRLGHEADERDYRVAAMMLAQLGMRSVDLITNNPAKISELRRLGVRVARRVPIEVPARPENAEYLRTKVRRMAHMLQLRTQFQYSEDQA
jgi:GTP cyclohydrolase II